MAIAEYKFQVGQLVYITEYNDCEPQLKSGIVIQADIYLTSPNPPEIIAENIYVIQLLTGLACSENYEYKEADIYDTLIEAANALEVYVETECTA